VSRKPLREVYSHSRLSSFEQCPKKFEYRYVLKLPSESEGIEGFTGKRVHEVIERLYLAVARGQVPSLEKVLRRFRILWDEHYDPERIRIVREGTRGLPQVLSRNLRLRPRTFSESGSDNPNSTRRWSR